MTCLRVPGRAVNERTPTACKANQGNATKESRPNPAFDLASQNERQLSTP